MGGIFFEGRMKRAGGKLRSLQKKSIRFFDHLPISALVRSDSSQHSVRFHSGNLFSTALAVMPIRSARAAALNVLSRESRAMIFSLLFKESAVTISNTKLWMIANEIVDLFYVHVGAVTTTIRQLQKEGIVRKNMKHASANCRKAMSCGRVQHGNHHCPAVQI